MKTLLKGTKEVPSAKHKLRNFVKNGNYNDALRDFRKVQPRNVHSTRGYNGEVSSSGIDKTKSSSKRNIIIWKVQRVP